MSYQSGNITYNRWQPDRQPGKDDYYYRDSNHSGNNRYHATKEQWQNQGGGGFHATMQQDTEPNQHRYREEGWRGDRSEFGYEHNTVSSHRYPQTFQTDQNPPPRRTSQERPHVSQNENFNSNRNSSYNPNRDYYSRDNWPDNQGEKYSPQYQQRQPHEEQYRSGNYNSSDSTNPQQNSQQNILGRSSNQESSPERYTVPDQSAGYGVRQDHAENRHIPPDHANYRHGSQSHDMYNDDHNNEYPQQNQDFQQYNSRPIYPPERTYDPVSVVSDTDVFIP